MPTQHVDSSSEEHLQDVANALLKARKVVVITGAGISTNSGIPDFRSENGLYSLIQAQFDAAARQKFQQQSTPSQTESDVEDRSSPEADRACKRRRLSHHDSIEVHAKEEGQEDQSDDDTRAIESRADSITVCQSPEPTSSADTTLEELPPPGPVLPKEDTIICTPQPVRTAIHVSIPTASSPLSSPPLEEFLVPPSTLRNPSPSSVPQTSRRHTRVSELSLPLSSSPLSSPPSLLYDPFRTTSLPDSSPSRRSSTSQSDVDETLAARLFGSSQGSTSARNSLPNMKGRDLFDANIWSDPLRTSVFYTFATSLRQKIRACEPTASHRFISHLKNRGKLVRCYTQNIDQIEEKVGLSTSLSEGPGGKGRFSRRSTATNNQLSRMVEEAKDTRKSSPDPTGNDSSQPQSEDGTRTPVESEAPSEQPKPAKLEPSRSSGVECVFLHGSLECLRCFRCGLITSWDDNRESETMSGQQPECPHCIGATVAREERGKRALGVGKLRPDIVLYGEEHPNAHLIGPIITHDIALCPDLLLILGTSLRVHGLKVMVREFANTIHNRGGKVVFVNFTKPPESSWGDFIDYWVQWDCDAWVDDLQTRIPKLWDIPQPQKEKPPAKNPVALRDSKANGAWCTMKIMDELGRITGSPMLKRSTSETDLRKSAKGSKMGQSASPEEKSIQVQTSESETPGTPETPTKEAITVKEETRIITTTDTCAVEATIEIIEEKPAMEKPTLAQKVTRPKRSRKSAPGALERAKKKPPSTLNPNHGRASKATPKKTKMTEPVDTTTAAQPIDAPTATVELVDTTTPRAETADIAATTTEPVGATVREAHWMDTPISTVEPMVTTMSTPPARLPNTPSTSATEPLSSSPPRGLFSTVVASVGSIFYSVKKNHRVRKRKKMYGETEPADFSSSKRRKTEVPGTPEDTNKQEEPQTEKEPQNLEDPELKLPPLTNMEPPTPPQLDPRPKAIEPLSPPPAPPNHFTPRPQMEPPARPLDFSSPTLDPPSHVMSRPRFETVPPTMDYSSPTPAPPVAFSPVLQPEPNFSTTEHFGPPLPPLTEFTSRPQSDTQPPAFPPDHFMPPPQLIPRPRAGDYPSPSPAPSDHFMVRPRHHIPSNLEREIDLGRRKAEEHQAEMDARFAWEATGGNQQRPATAAGPRTAADRDAAWTMVSMLGDRFASYFSGSYGQ